jgi:hypothetical protein
LLSLLLHPFIHHLLFLFAQINLTPRVTNNEWIGNTLIKKKKWEDAAEILLRASQQFKLAKQWGDSGSALVQAGDCALKVYHYTIAPLSSSSSLIML